MSEEKGGSDLTRREWLAAAGTSVAAAALEAAEPLPTIRFGRHTVSRLIVGGNPVSGTSHTSSALDRAMRGAGVQVGHCRTTFAKTRDVWRTWLRFRLAGPAVPHVSVGGPAWFGYAQTFSGITYGAR